MHWQSRCVSRSTASASSPRRPRRAASARRTRLTPRTVLAALFAVRPPLPVMDRGRPARALTTTSHGREQVHHVEAAVAADGTLLAVRSTFQSNVGAHLHKAGPAPALISALTPPGPDCLRAYRGSPPGRRDEQDAERCLSRLRPARGRVRHGAHGRHHCPRARPRSGPVTPAEHAWACRVTLPLGLRTPAYDSGDYPEVLRRALAALDYDGLRAKVPARAPRDAISASVRRPTCRRLGIGAVPGGGRKRRPLRQLLSMRSS